MARDTGTASFTPGVGTKSIAIGMSGVTWMDIEVSASGFKRSFGRISGGNQNCIPDDNGTVNGKAIVIKNTAGTTVIEGVWTSFGAGTANFNITTASGSMPQMRITFGT